MKLEMGPTNQGWAFEVLSYLGVFLLSLIIQAHVAVSELSTSFGAEEWG